jgi:hypothetical protein
VRKAFGVRGALARMLAERAVERIDQCGGAGASVWATAGSWFSIREQAARTAGFVVPQKVQITLSRSIQRFVTAIFDPW